MIAISGCVIVVSPRATMECDEAHVQREGKRVSGAKPLTYGGMRFSGVIVRESGAAAFAKEIGRLGHEMAPA